MATEGKKMSASHNPTAPTTKFQRIIVNIMTVLLLICYPFEILFFWGWSKVPTWIRHAIVMNGIAFVTFIVKKLGVKPGLHPDLSPEAHAMAILMAYGKYLPVNMRRIRFGLDCVSYIYPAQDGIGVQEIDLKTCEGYYVKCGPEKKSQEKKKVVLWFYGGAFVGGSGKANVGIATQFGQKVGADAFCVNYRRFPENVLSEAVDDGVAGYNFLVKTLKIKPENIVFLGISSGGGIAVSVAQRVLKASESLPAGLALLGPWIEYTGIFDSIQKNTNYDLVVTPRIYEYLFPYMGAICGGEDKRKELSPFHGPIKGLCPVHISYSNIEVCVDECRAFAEKLKEIGVEVEEYQAKYLCHAFQLFAAFMPEGRASLESIEAWSRKILGNDDLVDEKVE
mmetsp:Transcript_17659/g.26456  ORF Transcript_17659/g.26456 Transcript_17659/m.26456 type:complete len:394 (+) Transcript_17659:43-1224(+)